METLQPLIGIPVLLAIAWLLSENRPAVNWTHVALGLVIQIGLALLFFKVALFGELFLWINQGMLLLDRATEAGTSFVFGYLGGAELPFMSTEGSNSLVLAFRILPLILVFSALSAVLFYWRVLPLIVKGFAWLLRGSLRIGGALGLGTAANVFVGMVEAPLFVRPYLSQLTRSELFSLMTCGMATIAGTVMVIYATILADTLPGAMGHIIAASVISVPAALTIARLMVPETQASTAGELDIGTQADSTMDALTKGTVDGVQLLVNITAMLIVLIAVVSLLNEVLGLLPSVAGEPLTLQRMVGTLLAPLTWLLGIPWAEAVTAGTLLGTKTVLNEFIAYLNMAALPPTALSEHSRLIMTYAMCGFANPGSLGIMIGGMGTMAPERRAEIVALGPRSIIAGTLATCMTGAFAGLFA